jgi:hypothetical protein
MTRAPASPPGLKGAVEIDNSEILLQVQQILPGTYVVGAEIGPDQHFVSLGWVVVPSPEAVPDARAGESIKQTSTPDQATVLTTQVRVVPPPGFDPRTVQKIVLTDSTGDVLLEVATPGH